MKRFFFALSLFLLSAALYAPAQDDIPQPTVEGYITAVTSKTEFDVNGRHVTTTPQTEFIQRIITKQQQEDSPDPSLVNSLALGEQIQVFGDKHGKHPIVAKQIFMLSQNEKAPSVSGFAVIQKVLSGTPNLVVEADGYRIIIPSSTSIHYQAPLADTSIITPNLWISYSGELGKDGLMVANHAALNQFTLSAKEKKKIIKLNGTFLPPDYANKKDGSFALPYNAERPNGIKGKIPADAEMQKRLERIGQRLIPACQKGLSNDDPQKINFQFYAFDNKKIPGPIASPDGHVFIPIKMVSLMQNDDQIAALLADGIAEALEWQFKIGAAEKVHSGTDMMMVGTFVTGGLLSVALIGGGIAEGQQANTLFQSMEEQRARVALDLMRNAGFDIFQAPVAWQILSAKDAKKIDTVAMPKQSLYLWSLLAREYIPAQAAAASSVNTHAGNQAALVTPNSGAQSTR